MTQPALASAWQGWDQGEVREALSAIFLIFKNYLLFIYLCWLC